MNQQVKKIDLVKLWETVIESQLVFKKQLTPFGNLCIYIKNKTNEIEFLLLSEDTIFYYKDKKELRQSISEFQHQKCVTFFDGLSINPSVDKAKLEDELIERFGKGIINCNRNT